MIKLKRADLVLRAAGELVKRGYDLRLRLIGDGEEKSDLVALSKKLGLEKIVTFEGFLSPDEARERMADAQIYVMTSNKLEGWGSVIYEALNAGCATVASHVCGATPWLVKHQKTGLVYTSGSVKSLAAKLEMLVCDEGLRHDLGKRAYEQMRDEWNPTTAAERVIALYEALREGKDTPFADGPCSKAEIMSNSWFKDI